MKRLATLALLCSCAAANPAVTSREYKMLLQANLFTRGTEAAKVGQFATAAAAAITAAISRPVSGSAAFNKHREVSYYDTPAPCRLRSLGYSFRDRVDVSDPSDRDAALKFRSEDRYISGFEDMSCSAPAADVTTKLEDDVLLDGNRLRFVSSHSTKIDDYTRTIDLVNDIYDDFPGFQADYGSSLNANYPLLKVNGLTMYERRYKGQVIDLGSIDADLVISVWYTTSTPAAADVPAVVEASFDYSDGAAVYTKKVVNRAKRAHLALGAMAAWADPAASTKTQFVYGYGSFCSPTPYPMAPPVKYKLSQ
ncbi:hypothetical protein DIPPA_11249 [Diplonema papillatum]|nr:hypothetical protein DIPPA_11249 [Diplonema papillatum]